ncbi:MAG: hypothetical protein RMY34_32985 [Aulosira sp. DedQUE10]|nr:hypothetical protein [Aulosira sp. DedQUE10]
MENRSELIIWLVAWVAVFASIIRSQWNYRIPGVGLSLAYLSTLSMIHFFGGLIYALPWYSPKSAAIANSGVSYEIVLSGFTESVYGVIGFGLGSTICAYWSLRTFQPSWLAEFPKKPDLKLPKTFLLIGLLFFFVVSPILNQIPGFSAIASSGVFIFIVGLCLACWKAWYQQDKKAFLLWICVVFSFPFLTISTLGFIGYGAAASLIVLIFISNFYRPRWHVLISGFLVLILGLSVFVTYGRDRSEIRASVWGGEDFSARVERISKTFSNFEIIDPFKQEHLEAIDIRLNQNTLVGQAVNYLNSGTVKFAAGKTLVEAAIAVVPRLFWPNKPVSAGSGNLVTEYTGISFASGTSVGVGQVLEFYINFGSIGVFLGFLVLGTLIGIIDITAGHKLLCGNWGGFASWFLPGLGLLQPGGSLVEIVSSTAGSIVVMMMINRLYLQKIAVIQEADPDAPIYKLHIKS